MSNVTTWLTPREAAVLMHVGIGYVRKLIKEGTLPAYKVSDRGDVRIDSLEVDKFMRSRRMIEELGTSASVGLGDGLRITPRQVEIIDLVARGKTNIQIALDLGMSPQTVKNHMTSIMAKMGASNRTEAAVTFTKITQGRSN